MRGLLLGPSQYPHKLDPACTDGVPVFLIKGKKGGAVLATIARRAIVKGTTLTLIGGRLAAAIAVPSFRLTKAVARLTFIVHDNDGHVSVTRLIGDVAGNSQALFSFGRVCHLHGRTRKQSSRQDARSNKKNNSGIHELFHCSTSVGVGVDLMQPIIMECTILSRTFFKKVKNFFIVMILCKAFHLPKYS